MKAKFRITINRLPEIVRAVRTLAEERVYVGIPGDTPPRRSGEHPSAWNPITNVDLGFIHEFGAPGANIPARPHLIPATKGIQAGVVSLLHEAGRKTLMGDATAARKGLVAVGTLGRDAVKEKIKTGPFKELKPATIKARLRRRRKWSLRKRKAMYLAYQMESDPMGDNSYGKPLIDTAQYLNAFTYVIRKGDKTVQAPTQHEMDLNAHA